MKIEYMTRRNSGIMECHNCNYHVEGFCMHLWRETDDDDFCGAWLTISTDLAVVGEDN